MACCAVLPVHSSSANPQRTSRDNIPREARANYQTRAVCLVLSRAGPPAPRGSFWKSHRSVKWLLCCVWVPAEEQRGAAHTANLRCPSKGARPFDVAVETADVRGSGWRSLLGGPVENVARPATLLSCAEVRLPLVSSSTDSTMDAPSLPSASPARNSAQHTVFQCHARTADSCT
ncbi:hypothetical protein SVAN01_10415 [Stagonosporopsis vannaccii]|nr:hypothetical protein SVAN01_10415 [Stagonosporopsis vannaccii]